MALKTKKAATEQSGVDLLMLDIGGVLDQCADELGIAGCDRCPVRIQCKRLWGEIENSFDHHLKIREYRIYCQNFFNLKRERDAILNKNREATHFK